MSVVAASSFVPGSSNVAGGSSSFALDRSLSVTSSSNKNSRTHGQKAQKLVQAAQAMGIPSALIKQALLASYQNTKNSVEAPSEPRSDVVDTYLSHTERDPASNEVVRVVVLAYFYDQNKFVCGCSIFYNREKLHLKGPDVARIVEAHRSTAYSRQLKKPFYIHVGSNLTQAIPSWSYPLTKTVDDGKVVPNPQKIARISLHNFETALGSFFTRPYIRANFYRLHDIKMVIDGTVTIEPIKNPLDRSQVVGSGPVVHSFDVHYVDPATSFIKA